MWIKKTEKIEISMDLVKKIIAFLLEKEWKKLTKIENNVHYGTHDVGWGPWERKERFLTWKNFRIVFSDK